MRVVLDECLPRKLAARLVGHTVTTVPDAGWAGIGNGKLLRLIDGKFDAFVTVDRNMATEQKTDALSFGIIVLRASSNRFVDLEPHIPKILAAIAELQPGQLVVVANPGS